MDDAEDKLMSTLPPMLDCLGILYRQGTFSAECRNMFHRHFDAAMSNADSFLSQPNKDRFTRIAEQTLGEAITSAETEAA